VSTPVSAIGAPEPVDRIHFHPAFAADARETATLLRHEEICQELLVVLGLPADTAYDALPVLVEQRLTGTAAGS
jgi:hypothetical protein